jgi:hypothetical protein
MNLVLCARMCIARGSVKALLQNTRVLCKRDAGLFFTTKENELILSVFDEDFRIPHNLRAPLQLTGAPTTKAHSQKLGTKISDTRMLHQVLMNSLRNDNHVQRHHHFSQSPYAKPILHLSTTSGSRVLLGIVCETSKGEHTSIQLR